MSTLQSIAFALLVLITLVGMVANGFIALFICVDWIRSRKLSPTDLILCCLGLSRCLWHMVVILNSIVGSFFKCTHFQNHMWIIASAMWVFINSVNLWFATWLSVLYFVKVAIFSHPIFLHMKQRFSGLVLWLLLGSVVFCAAVTMIVVTVSRTVFSICITYRSLTCNGSASAMHGLHFCIYSAALFNTSNIIPFVLLLLSFIFLMSSLWKHLKRMQHHGTDIRDLNTRVHWTAIKALASFAVLYLISFVAVVLQSVNILSFEHPWTVTVFENVTSLYPSGHSIILILINPKLKQKWVRMLHHVKCRLSEAPF